MTLPAAPSSLFFAPQAPGAFLRKAWLSPRLLSIRRMAERPRAAPPGRRV